MFKNETYYNLELLLLALLSKSDIDCFEICDIINRETHEHIKAKDGVLFTILYHFENSKLISSYQHNQCLYYHIENAGKVRFDMLLREFENHTQDIHHILNYTAKEDES